MAHTSDHEIRTEKCSDTCQHKIKCALTFSGNDRTLRSRNMYSIIIFWLGHLSDQTGICTGQSQKCSENVRCPIAISCSVRTRVEANMDMCTHTCTHTHTHTHTHTQPSNCNFNLRCHPTMLKSLYLCQIPFPGESFGMHIIH